MKDCPIPQNYPCWVDYHLDVMKWFKMIVEAERDKPTMRSEDEIH